MNARIWLSVILFCLALTGFAENGFTYNRSQVHHLFGLTEKKEGATIIKKRTVSSSSSQQMVDRKESEELALDRYPKVKVVATGYYAGYESTGKRPGHPSYGITYSGVKVRRGTFSTIAADLRVFPLGTILYIPGYGYGVVADKGGAIRGNKIDLYFETKQDVYAQWGKKTVDVYVVHKGNGKVTEEMMDALHEKGVAAMARPFDEKR